MLPRILKNQSVSNFWLLVTISELGRLKGEWWVEGGLNLQIYSCPFKNDYKEALLALFWCTKLQAHSLFVVQTSILFMMLPNGYPNVLVQWG